MRFVVGVLGVAFVAATVGCADKVVIKAPEPVVVIAPPPPPEPPPPPPPEPLKIPAPVKFATGSDVLTAESDVTLKYVAEYLSKKPETEVMRIEGHTDNVGGADPNQKLSEKRALSVARWLVKNGIACKRLLPVGFGETNPVADNNTDDGKAQNRRTVFIDAIVSGKKVSDHEGGRVAGDPCAAK
ncbi:MAG TPA: OmpA family protein [Byssovorax sp.]